MGELGWSKLLKFKLLTDNRRALAFISTRNFSNRSRHIAVQYSSLRDWVRFDQISLDHVPTTTAMLSYILTKHLVQELQDSIIQQMGQFVSYSTRACIAHERGACAPVLQMGWYPLSNLRRHQIVPHKRNRRDFPRHLLRNFSSARRAGGNFYSTATVLHRPDSHGDCTRASVRAQDNYSTG